VDAGASSVVFSPGGVNRTVIGARYYHPALGRWTQRDPLEGRINPTMPGEANPYAYAGNDPANMVDPTGCATCEQLVGLACGVMIGVPCGALCNAATAGWGAVACAIGCSVITTDTCADIVAATCE
jgi:RHS repeat-associated protein